MRVADLNVAALGSLGMITHKPMHGDTHLPDWLERGVESSLRDTEDDAPPPPTLMSFSSSSAPIARTKGFAPPVVLSPAGGASPAAGTRAQYTDLDSFYADADEEDEESESEEDDEDDAEDEEVSEEGSEEEDGSESEERQGHR